MKLSILVTTMDERMPLCGYVIGELIDQIGTLPVEVIWLGDNRKRSIGAKRQLLLEMAQGDYVAFVDDDDLVMGNYISAIMPAIESHSGVDVITFDIVWDSVQDGLQQTLKYGIGEERRAGGLVIHGPPNHWMVWRRDLALLERYQDLSIGEDVAWADAMRQHAKTEHHINGTLLLYNFNPDNEKERKEHEVLNRNGNV